MESNHPIGFKSQYNFHDAFYLRGDLLRHGFGLWDCVDPVAVCILDLSKLRTNSAICSMIRRMASAVRPPSQQRSPSGTTPAKGF
jgi:hypothetical protein